MKYLIIIALFFTACKKEDPIKEYKIKLSVVGKNQNIWFSINQDRVDLMTDKAYSGDTLKITLFNAFRDVSATLYVDDKKVWNDAPNVFQYILK
jgi:hypothetical protein